MMSLDMLPRLAVNDTPDGVVSNGVSFCNIGATLSLLIAPSNLTNIILAKSRSGMMFTMAVTVLVNLVLYVVKICSEKQMIRVDALSTITRVQAMEIVRDGATMMKLPGNTMGRIPVFPEPYHTVPGWPASTLPVPAFIVGSALALLPKRVLESIEFLGIVSIDILVGWLGNGIATSTCAQLCGRIAHVITSLIGSGCADGRLQRHIGFLFNISTITHTKERHK